MSSIPLIAPNSQLSSFWNLQASSYDEHFTHRLLGQWLRQRVWEKMDHWLNNASHLLDLGCGTGEDAARFLRQGRSVVGVDISPAMLEQAANKAKAENLNISLHCLSLDRLDQLATPKLFDGAYCNFGAINCCRNPRFLAQEVALRLRPQARLIIVAMGPFCLLETLAHLARGSWKKAWQRRGKGGTIPLRYDWHVSLKQLLGAHFRTLHVSALGAALPPTDFAHWIERFSKSARILAKVDRMVSCWPLAPYMSDHYLLVAEKR